MEDTPPVYGSAARRQLSRVGWASCPPWPASRRTKPQNIRRKMRRTAGKMPTLPETEMHARRRAMLLRTVCNRDNCLGSFRQLVAESGREHNRRGFAPLGDVIG